MKARGTDIGIHKCRQCSSIDIILLFCILGEVKVDESLFQEMDDLDLDDDDIE